MGVQRYKLPSGAMRYRARVKWQGRYVATRVFERKADAVAWEQDQRRRLRLGEWIDPASWPGAAVGRSRGLAGLTQLGQAPDPRER